MQKVLKIWSLLVCLSVLVAFKITKIDIYCIITCIRIYNAKKKKSWSCEILIQKARLPLVHSHSVSYGRSVCSFISHNATCFPTNCFQLFLGLTIVPWEIKTKSYAELSGGSRRFRSQSPFLLCLTETNQKREVWGRDLSSSRSNYLFVLLAFHAL